MCGTHNRAELTGFDCQSRKHIFGEHLYLGKSTARSLRMLEDGEPEMASILGKRLDGLTHSYPSALDEVRDLFDLTIIRDLEEREGSKAPARIELVYALGAPEDLTAGVRRHQMTPSFCSVAELNAFCERHLKRFREISRAQGASGQYAVVDATEWV